MPVRAPRCVTSSTCWPASGPVRTPSLARYSSITCSLKSLTSPTLSRDPHQMWATRQRSVSELHGLDLEELLEAVRAVLAAVAAVLVATERGDGVERTTVDLDLAGADATSDLLGPLGVGSLHATRQAVDRVVGDADRILFVLVADDRQDRAEDLLLGDGHVVAHLAEDRRLHEVAVGVHVGRLLGATDDEVGALVDALLDVAGHAL